MEADTLQNPTRKIKKEPKEILEEQEFALRKRLPRRLPKRKNDVYVSTRTNMPGQLQRCRKMLERGANELYVHGLGAAINRAINLSLQLQSEAHGSLQVAAHTSTVELVDDLEPEDEDGEPTTKTRNNSAIHIRVYRPEEPLPLPPETSRIPGS